MATTEKVKEIAEQIASGDVSRLAVMLYDPENGEEFEVYTRMLSGKLRDRVAPIIKRDEGARKKLRTKFEEYRRFAELGESKGEAIKCPECGHDVERTGAVLQAEYYRANAEAVREQGDEIARSGRDLNVRFVLEMSATIFDPNHPTLSEGVDEETTARRRKYLESKPTSDFWTEQPIPRLESVVRRFRGVVQLG